MVSRTARTTVSEEEFLKLPETLQRLELVDGEVLMPPAPSRAHQRLVGHLFRILDAWARVHPPHEALMAPLDLRLGPNRIVQPDVAVFPTHGSGAEGPVLELPLLVAEVLSTNRSYDRITKRHLYAEAGVPEYWVVDPEELVVEVMQGMMHVDRMGKRVESARLPGLVLDVEALFLE